MHWSTTVLSRKIAAHEGAFMSLFTRQLGGQRVLPSKDSEDTQQQFSRARPPSNKVFLPPFYPWHHLREEMYQALSRFTVLHVTGSWARAWERGYHSTKIPLREVHMHYLNVSSIYASTVVLRKRAYRRYTLLCAQTRGWADISNIAAFYQEKHPCLHYHNFQECIAGYCTPVA